MRGLTPPRPGRSVVVALFEREPRARQAVQAVLDLGVDEHTVGLLAPGSSSTVTSDVARLLAVAAADGGDITTVLASLGVPEGEARFCAQETSNGRTIVVVDAGSGFEAVRDALLRHGGYDVQSRRRELARANGAGVAGGSGPRSIDLTGSWEDVADEATTGAEGGADRRIPRQGTDQLIPARDVRPAPPRVPRERRLP